MALAALSPRSELLTRLLTILRPVAMNSGVVCPKQSFTKQAGTIKLEIIEPIPPGLERKEFMDLLEMKIEKTSRNL